MGEPPDEAVVWALVREHKRDEKIVRGWSRAKAQAVLDGLRREAAIVARHAAVKAGSDVGEELGRVSDPVRINAADWLEQALVRGSAEIALALSFAVLEMQPDEQRRLAEHMARKFREPGRAAGPPAQPPP
jgi:hypothetical protein